MMAALEECVHQIEQMRDMFDDDDSTIEAAVDQANELLEQYHKNS